MAIYKLDKGNGKAPADHLTVYAALARTQLEEAKTVVSSDKGSIIAKAKTFKKGRRASLAAYIIAIAILSFYIIERMLFGGFFTGGLRLVALISAGVFAVSLIATLVLGVIVKKEYRRNSAHMIAFILFIYAVFISAMSLLDLGVVTLIVAVTALLLGMIFYISVCDTVSVGKSVRSVIFSIIALALIITAVSGVFVSSKNKDNIECGLFKQTEKYKALDQGTVYYGRSLTMLDALGIRRDGTYTLSFKYSDSSSTNFALIETGAFTDDRGFTTLRIAENAVIINADAFKGSSVKAVYTSADTLFLYDCFEGSEVERVYLETDGVALVACASDWVNSGKVTFVVPSGKLEAYRIANPLIAELFVAA